MIAERGVPVGPIVAVQSKLEDSSSSGSSRVDVLQCQLHRGSPPVGSTSSPSFRNSSAVRSYDPTEAQRRPDHLRSLNQARTVLQLDACGVLQCQLHRGNHRQLGVPRLHPHSAAVVQDRSYDPTERSVGQTTCAVSTQLGQCSSWTSTSSA